MHANDKLVMIKDGRGSCHTLAGEQIWELSKTFSGRVGAKGGILPLQDGSFVFYHYSHVIDAVVQVVLVNAQGYAHTVWLASHLAKATAIAHVLLRGSSSLCVQAGRVVAGMRRCDQRHAEDLPQHQRRGQGRSGYPAYMRIGPRLLGARTFHHAHNRSACLPS